MREQTTFRWYFAVTSVMLMLFAAVILKVQARQFEQGTVTIHGVVENAPPVAVLDVDIASTPTTREKGLSGREGLEKNQGMLFLFDAPSTQTFWMKDMRFPIDIIWIRNGVVTELTPDLPPPLPGQILERYTSIEPIDTVLEVPRGFIKKYGITPGMEVRYTVDK